MAQAAEQGADGPGRGGNGAGGGIADGTHGAPPYAADPRVAAALARVTGRRIGYVTALFAELGFPEDEARHRGLLAYTAYLGHTQLGHAVPRSLPEGAARDRYLDGVIDTLVRPPRASGETEHDRS